MSPSSIISQLQSEQVQYLLFGITCVGFYSFLRMWPNYTKHCKTYRKRLAGIGSSKNYHGDQQSYNTAVKIAESSV